MKHAIRPTQVLLLLSALLFAVTVLSLAFGSAERASSEIVLQIRLPRVLLAALVGAGLATAGALLQALLQ
ncbi:MAG: iron chelate uptake ABC transporter family permease subunit, partial [Deltaproteobacteria bacterium]|nr:iron chelate uptake ABC transporter family permease subunit [Deltaproteobacteria bacterium]